MSIQKPYINIVAVGQVDSGKSTTLGHLMKLLGAVTKEEVDAVATKAAQCGKASFSYAFLLDKGKEERERGLTIQGNIAKLETDKYCYTLIDAPGHSAFLKNAIVGMECADVALLFVPADGNFTSSLSSSDGYTREHLAILSYLGIQPKRIIICVNKMDSDVAAYREARFNEVKVEMDSLLKRFYGASVPVTSITYVPISGWLGDNLVTKSTKMPWYTGLTLKSYLDLVVPPVRKSTLPLRISITSFYQHVGTVGQIVCGYIQQGSLAKGDKISFFSGDVGMDKEVLSIQQHHVTLPKAIAGDCIGISIKDLSATEFNRLKRGDVIYLRSQGVIKPIASLIAQVTNLNGIFSPGACPLIFCGTRFVPCKMMKINWKIGRSTGTMKVLNPPTLQAYELAEVEFQLSSPLYVEAFVPLVKNILGRLVIIDHSSTVMFGTVTFLNPEARFNKFKLTCGTASVNALKDFQVRMDLIKELQGTGVLARRRLMCEKKHLFKAVVDNLIQDFDVHRQLSLSDIGKHIDLMKDTRDAIPEVTYVEAMKAIVSILPPPLMYPIAELKIRLDLLKDMKHTIPDAMYGKELKAMFLSLPKLPANGGHDVGTDAIIQKKIRKVAKRDGNMKGGYSKWALDGSVVDISDADDNDWDKI